MARALEIFRELSKYNIPVTNSTFCSPIVDNTFNYRKCAITVRWAEVLKGSTIIPRLYGKVGTAMLPGSEYVLDRNSMQLVPCNPQLCPYGEDVVQGNATVRINRAPHAGMTAMLIGG